MSSQLVLNVCFSESSLNPIILSPSYLIKWSGYSDQEMTWEPASVRANRYMIVLSFDRTDQSFPLPRRVESQLSRPPRSLRSGTETKGEGEQGVRVRTTESNQIFKTNLEKFETRLAKSRQTCQKGRKGQGSSFQRCGRELRGSGRVDG